MQIWKKLGLTVVFCVLSAGMTVNAGFTGSNVHSAGQSMGVGGLLEESMDPEACLEAAQNAKETRKKIYGYENLGVAKVNDYLNIRKDPSENGELVGKLPKNGGADVLSEENGWYKIKSGKVTGYVKADYMVTGEEARSLADKEATNMAVCNSGGLRVRDHSGSQAQCGKKVSLSEAQPGDLVFYAKNGKINHVAIYIGGGQVIHASNPRTGIKISNLSYRTPYSVRRVLS